VIWVFRNAPNWHGVGQALLVKQLSIEVSSLRGNLEAHKRDNATWMREIHECNQEILRKVATIESGGVKDRALEMRVDRLQDEIHDIDQVLHALPCFLDRDIHDKLMQMYKKPGGENA